MSFDLYILFYHLLPFPFSGSLILLFFSFGKPYTKIYHTIPSLYYCFSFFGFSYSSFFLFGEPYIKSFFLHIGKWVGYQEISHIFILFRFIRFLENFFIKSFFILYYHYTIIIILFFLFRGLLSFFLFLFGEPLYKIILYTILSIYSDPRASGASFIFHLSFLSSSPISSFFLFWRTLYKNIPYYSIIILLHFLFRVLLSFFLFLFRRTLFQIFFI